MGPPLLELEKVSFRYQGRFDAIHEVDLCVRKGERVALLGPTRSGKTTLLKILYGGLTPETGKVRVFGECLPLERTKRLTGIQARIGMSSQHPGDKFFRPTVLDELIYGSGVADIPSAIRTSHVQKVSEAIGINELLDRSPEQLSEGEKQMVGIASALIGFPEVLMLDEPTAGLSDFLKRHLVRLLTRSFFAPTTLLLSTHDLLLAEALCERAVLLSPDHRKVADGPIQEIFRNTDLLVTVQLIYRHGYHLAESSSFIRRVHESDSEDRR
jgi:cobalt/nickel transport system ATP-binding protein